MKATEVLARAAELLGATPASTDGFTFEDQGITCELRVTEEEATSRLDIDVSVEGLGVVDFEPETGFHRFGKRLGACRELQLSDEAFDPVVFIDSEEEDAVVCAYVATPEARAAVLDIVGAGDRLQLSRSGLRVALRGSFDPDRPVRVARALVRFVRALPRPLPPPREAGRSSWRRGLLALTILLPLPWMGYGLAMPVAPRAILLPWVAGLGLNLLVTLLLLPFVALFVHKRSAGFRLLVIAAFLLTLVLLPAGPAALFALNASHDTPVVVEPAVVMSARCAEDDDGPRTDVKVNLQLRRTADRTIGTFALSGCQVIPRGKVVSLLTSPGALGFERWHGLEVP